MSDGKNQLVDFNPAQEDPYKAKGNDFPVKKVMAGTGQSEDAPGEKNQLATWNKNQEGPRNAEGPGGTSDSMATKGEAVKAFKVGKNSGEGSESPSALAMPESIDCETGEIMVKGYKQTRVKEVPERTVTIG